jgi:hypothetical protein
VEGVLFSPNYATDHTMIAYTNYTDLERNEGGYSVFRSTDSGLSWTLAFTSSYPAGDPDKRRQMALGILPSPAEASSVQSPTLKMPDNTGTLVRTTVSSPDFASDLTGYILTEAALLRSLDGGDSWQVINSPSQNYAYDASLLLSPNFKLDRTLYLTGGPDLFRSTDGGDSWERWRYELTTPTEESYTLVIKAISPLLADGAYRLFISSGYAGQFWALDPAKARWETVTAGSK